MTPIIDQFSPSLHCSFLILNRPNAAFTQKKFAIPPCLWYKFASFTAQGDSLGVLNQLIRG